MLLQTLSAWMVLILEGLGPGLGGLRVQFQVMRLPHPHAKQNATISPNYIPRVSTYTTILESGTKKPSPLWFWGSNSIIVVYMDPLGSRIRYSIQSIP